MKQQFHRGLSALAALVTLSFATQALANDPLWQKPNNMSLPQRHNKRSGTDLPLDLNYNQVKM